MELEAPPRRQVEGLLIVVEPHQRLNAQIDSAMLKSGIMPRVSLLITDLDDTLWYWFKVWHASFVAELGELERVTGIPSSILIPEIKRIHEKHHTAEYAFLLQEMPSLQAKFGPTFDPKVELPSVIEAFRRARRANTALYATVYETLLEIRAKGTRVVAFTESQQYYSVQRLKAAGLDGVVDVLYATGESASVTPEQISNSREFDDICYSLKKTRLVVLPSGLRKPDPGVLSGIVADEHGSIENTLYVGDTLSKDIAMANQAGVMSAHAKYGETHHLPGYDLLKAVTHWTAADVERQRSATPVGCIPTFVLDQNFGQILNLARFTASKHE